MDKHVHIGNRNKCGHFTDKYKSINTRNWAKNTENKIILTNMALPLTILLKTLDYTVGDINYANIGITKPLNP